ncbi:MAG: DNA-binding response regulator [Ideonella sp. MAG2]|nr:MAG: DNA-binding response regulator [Ideonella sp. MAG2]
MPTSARLATAAPPASSAQPLSEAGALEAAPRAEQTTNVLLVEDQSLVRAGMKTMLHVMEPTLQITEAGSYDEALRKLEQYKIDFVLLDIDLRSEKSGLDLLAHVREQGLPVKVIMLSASDDRDTVMHCIASGASGYIAKSSGNESVFAEALNTVLNDGVFLPASILAMPRSGVAATQQASPQKTLADFALSPRMTEVLYYLCQGLPNKGIARQMGISEGTVRKTYVSELLRHFKVARRTELIIEVSRLGLRVPRPISPPNPGLTDATQAPHPA